MAEVYDWHREGVFDKPSSYESLGTAALGEEVEALVVELTDKKMPEREALKKAKASTVNYETIVTIATVIFDELGGEGRTKVLSRQEASEIGRVIRAALQDLASDKANSPTSTDSA